MVRAQITVTALTEEYVDDFSSLWIERRGEAGLSRDHATRLVRDGRLREAVLRDGVTVLIALGEGRVVGYAWISERLFSAVLDVPTVTIEDVFVAEQNRGRGVAATLLTAAASHAQRLCADQVTVCVPAHARDLNRSLARMGFAPVVTRRVATTSHLLRRLRAKGAPPPVEAPVLARRRSLRQRARAGRR